MAQRGGHLSRVGNGNGTGGIIIWGSTPKYPPKRGVRCLKKGSGYLNCLWIVLFRVAAMSAPRRFRLP